MYVTIRSNVFVSCCLEILQIRQKYYFTYIGLQKEIRSSPFIFVSFLLFQFQRVTPVSRFHGLWLTNT